MSTWSRPPPGVFKYNVCGYSSETMTFSTIGCVMRNLNGYWIGGYYSKIGYETAVICDLRSIFYAVKLAHDEGRRNVQVESCSNIAIDHILNPRVGFEGSDVVNEIRGFMNTFDSCILQCVQESSNQLAISAAMYAIDEGNPVRYINSCPSDLLSIMAEDWLSSLVLQMTGKEHTLLMRMEPKLFTDTIKCLSDEQKKWVRATGFEKLMSFKEVEYPPSIGKKLVSSYNPLSSSMTIKGKTLTITKESVHDILGLPRGLNQIDFVTDYAPKYAWRAQFNNSMRESFKITGRDIYEAIKANDEVNANFKMNFMVLMSNIFFKGSRNPYVIQNIVGFNGDLDNCNDYNWCEYFIRCLNKETSAWHEKKDHVFYTGSLAFLILFYIVEFVDKKASPKNSIMGGFHWNNPEITAAFKDAEE